MITAKLTRDTEVRTVDVMINEATGEMHTRIEVRRTVTLALDGADVMMTGYEITRRYRPETLVLIFQDGKLTGFKTYGTGIKKDGTVGKVTLDNSFSPNGERRFFKRHSAAPAEIMEIVRRYAA